LDSSAVSVFGNMNYTADGGMVGVDTEYYAARRIQWMVGVDTECYAARRIQWMVEGNMNGVGSFGEGYCF